ncbi:Hydrogen ion transmembrane transporter activity protein, partial [Halocaridina rubra]
FGRWSALIVGLLYGRSHYKSLAAKEVIIREEEAKQAVIREAKLAEEKVKLNRSEMLILAKEAGVKVPEGF